MRVRGKCEDHGYRWCQSPQLTYEHVECDAQKGTVRPSVRPSCHACRSADAIMFLLLFAATPVSFFLAELSVAPPHRRCLVQC